MKFGKLFIGGEWRDGQGIRFTSESPETKTIIWEGHSASLSDVDLAVSAARNSFKPWALLSFDARIQFIQQYQKILTTKKEQLGKLIAIETGKPEWEALTEAAAMIGKVELSIQAYKERTGQKSSKIAGATAILRHKPHGVVAIYGPFNFPGHLPNGHIIPALIAGNTVIFKPSELTPAVGEFMVNCWAEAGLPDGVLNLVQGSADTGISLSSHDDLNGLFFTGSSATGMILHQQFGSHPDKVLALEMGGNNPLIVIDISDLKGAVYHTIQSAFVTAGQRCTCARRLIIPQGIEGDQFLLALITATRKIKVGPQPDGSDPFLGSVISNASADHLISSQEKLVDLGGNILVEMERLEQAKPYLRPGIINVTEIENLPDEEYFGPLLQVIRTSDFDSAIDVANNTKFGLSGGILTDDQTKYETYLALSNAGIVNWNRPLTGASGAAPFGGIAASGNHRPSAYYAADYCAYPVASLEAPIASLPETLSPGIEI